MSGVASLPTSSLTQPFICSRQILTIFGDVAEVEDMFKCPVCGYNSLRKPPENHEICPSCGTQFGYTDETPEPLALAHTRLRRNWISNGARWHSRVVPQPPFWDPWTQLISAHLLDIALTAPNQVDAVYSKERELQYA
jgi:hypothetical protein